MRSSLKKWKKIDREIARQVRGKLRPASGAIDGFKGDQTTQVFSVPLTTALLESKSTEKKSLSVKLEWLEKITTEALMAGRTPVFVMTIGKSRWYCVPDYLICSEEQECKKVD